MWNLRELVPTERVSRGSGQVALLSERAEPLELADIAVRRIDGSTGSVQAILDDTFTDAFAVLQDGVLAAEWYTPGSGPDRVHAVLSVTKSIVGCVAGVLLDRGVLDESRPVEYYVPELGASGFSGASVRDVLDMRSGVRFVEDYVDPAAEIRLMDGWVLGEKGLYAYLQTLGADRGHGGPFRYRSAETDALGWVCERAAGAPMATLMSRLIWAPMGAEHDAEIMCDPLGNAVHDGGFGATTRDLLRFGQLLLAGGTASLPGGDSRTVLPARWLRKAWAVDADARRAFLDSPAEQSFPGGWYRNQFWFRVGAYGDVLLCLGIHGQLVYVSRRTRTVVVKLSGWPDALNPAFTQNTLRACDAISGALTNRRSAGDGRRLPGVVSGLSRGGAGRGPSVG